MTEKKSTFPSIKNQDYKKVKLEIERINELLKNISTDTISELNKLM